MLWMTPARRTIADTAAFVTPNPAGGGMIPGYDSVAEAHQTLPRTGNDG